MAVDYAPTVIEIETAVNRTEENIKANKIAMIESIFSVKRQALRALTSIKEQYTAALSAFFNASIQNLNAALVAAQNGITGNKGHSRSVFHAQILSFLAFFQNKRV